MTKTLLTAPVHAMTLGKLLSRGPNLDVTNETTIHIEDTEGVCWPAARVGLDDAGNLVFYANSEARSAEVRQAYENSRESSLAEGE